jgi:hypothetical protein
VEKADTRSIATALPIDLPQLVVESGTCQPRGGANDKKKKTTQHFCIVKIGVAHTMSLSEWIPLLKVSHAVQRDIKRVEKALLVQSAVVGAEGRVAVPYTARASS